MKKQIFILAFFIAVILSSCTPTQKYERTYTNPILQGFYPDPGICRVGEDYYLINSTFSYFPGIPIFHSKDLVNWEQIGHVLDRPEQLKLDSLGLSHGVFAPAISYHEGTFYVINTIVNGIGNFFVTATDPAGPWSDPITLPFGGIDPSFFFDDDGMAYIVHNGPPPGDPLYHGHRAIYMYEFDPEKKQLVSDEILLVNGGTDISKQPIWIEGPHLYKIKDYYYLMCAEGGTSEGHSEVIFRSKDVKGPYVSWEKNPILTQRHLDPSRKFAVTSTGHADLIEDTNGDWWAVFLGCRPYPPEEMNHYNTGRETFMAPVTWENNWPLINAGNDLVKYQYRAPELKEYITPNTLPKANFSVKDEFGDTVLAFAWNQIRTPHTKWYSLSENPGHLQINLREEKLSELVNPSFIGRRQQHAFCTAQTAIEFQPENQSEVAGLAIFQNEKHFYLVEKGLNKNQQAVIRLVKSGDELQMLKEMPLDENKAPLILQITARGKDYDFAFSYDGKELISLADDVDGTFLSTKTGGGFVGAYFGMYASSNGTPSDNHADFDWFKYEGNDPVYNNAR